ncbi:MAG TPA: hypothetical protein VGW36_04615, partial [Pyrinomonadaceae bacterium]|nr:hypothetical protein [Pyrinomonadaceae bacterium]
MNRSNLQPRDELKTQSASYKHVLKPNLKHLVSLSRTLILIALSFIFVSYPLRSYTMSAQENVRVRAPELTGGRGWLNTEKPLSLAALKGKVVLLDFWT